MFGFFIFLAVLWILLCVFIAIKANSSQPQDTDFESTKYKPKIGAEISNSLYDEVTSYCRKHRMTISDLIRKSVRFYMDTYK